MTKDMNEFSLQNFDTVLSSSPFSIVNAALWKNSGDLFWEWKKNAPKPLSLFEKNEKKMPLCHFKKGNERTEVFFEIELPMHESNHLLTALIRLNLNDPWIQSLSSGETGCLALLSDTGEVLGVSKTDFSCSMLLLKDLPKYGFEFPGDTGKNYWGGIDALTWKDLSLEGSPVYVLASQEKNEVFALILMLDIAFWFSILLLLLATYLLNRVLSKWVLSPLEILYQGMQKAAAGNLSFKTRIDSASEMGVLSKNFDSMIEKMNAKQLRLEADKQALLLLNQSILASLTTGILVIDHEQKVLFMNPTGEHLADVAFVNIQGKKCGDIPIPLEIQKLIQSTLDKNQEIDSMEITLSDRKPSIIFGVKTSFLKRDQALSGLIVSFNDITDRKRLEKELAQNEKSLLLAVLSGGMAHDFNNLLNRIKLGVDVLSNHEQAGNTEEIWDELHNAVDEGQQMTRSLSAFTRNESVLLVPVNLKEFIQGIENKHRSALQTLEINLKIQVSENLWIDAEPYYLGQIFQNLIQNAEQALAKNPGVIDITLSLEDSQALFVVRDSGPGIPPEVLGHLFEPFFSTKILSSHSGWGLGLALVKSLVEKMRGTISAKSVFGEGTTFFLRFPVLLNETVGTNKATGTVNS